MKLGKNQCVKDNAVSEQAFTSASHESPDNIVSEKDASRAGVYGFAILMFALGFCVVFALTLPFLSPYTVLASAIAGLALSSTFRVATQWEHVAFYALAVFEELRSLVFMW